MFTFILIVSVGLAARPAATAESTKSPHIILIIGDDVGFNDVSFRGSEDIHTPNIDSLAYAGRILDRHYALPTCTPSRASLLTGLHAVRTGMQGFPLETGEPRGLPLNFTILPQFLKRLNYSTHLVGKWHEGFHHWEYTPTYRGFDSFLGYYNGFIGYFSHDVRMAKWPEGRENSPKGYDMRRNKEVAWDLRGRYATDIFTSEAEKLIWEHDAQTPLFLQVAHLAVHTGEDMTDNEVVSEAANNRRFGFIKDAHRRRYAGSMTAMDDSVGRVITALADRDMLADSIVVFLADNGAPTVGYTNNSGSNWPLRGQKETIFDGGVRTIAAVWHAGMKPTSELHSDLFHIADWLPTFYEAAGGNVSDLGDIDGLSQWARLSGKENVLSPRTELLVNSRENEDAGYIDHGWKLIVGTANVPIDFSKLQGDPGRTPGAQPYNLCGVTNSDSSRFLFQASKEGDFQRLGERAAQLRRLASLPATCRHNATQQVPDCTNGCLFNLLADPCETTNMVKEHPEVVSSLLLKLRSWDSKIVRQLNQPVDLASDPRNFGGVWVPWLDMPPKPEPGSEPVHDNQTHPTGAGSRKTDVTFIQFILCLLLAFCMS